MLQRAEQVAGLAGESVRRHRRGLNFFAVSLIGISIAACSATPDCRIASDQQASDPAHAGCLVVQNDRILMVRDRLSGKLGFPGGGSRPPEASQCTAHRETWEETGYAVEVGAHLSDLGTGFRLYRCEIIEGPTVAESVVRPLHTIYEIEAIHWRSPYDIKASEWRFPWQYEEVLQLFDAERRSP